MTIIFIILGVILFNLIILAHEWGHYFTAKTFGVKVNEFALGMGPTLFKFKKGDTTFSLRALPLGGFCSMEGEDENSNHPQAFGTKKAWQKIIIVATGAIMNIILGLIITFTLLIQNNNFASKTISKFTDNASSCSYGLMVGDEILKVNNTKIFTYKDLGFALSSDKDSQFDITVKRKNETLQLKDVVFNTNLNSKGKQVTEMDFYVEPIKKDFFTLMRQTFLDTVSTVQIVWSSLIGIVTGRYALSGMSGPIGIASVIGKATSEGLRTSVLAGINNLLSIMAMITINLGVMNLLPLPALDGGRLIFLLFELLTRKKVNQKYEGWIHAFGFVLFIVLMIFISYSDIMRLFGKN